MVKLSQISDSSAKMRKPKLMSHAHHCQQRGPSASHHLLSCSYCFWNYYNNRFRTFYNGMRDDPQLSIWNYQVADPERVGLLVMPPPIQKLTIIGCLRFKKNIVRQVSLQPNIWRETNHIIRPQLPEPSRMECVGPPPPPISRYQTPPFC